MSRGIDHRFASPPLRCSGNGHGHGHGHGHVQRGGRLDGQGRSWYERCRWAGGIVALMVGLALSMPACRAKPRPGEQVLVPAGAFLMGEPGAKLEQKPLRRVYVDAFYIDRYEVTNAEYARFVAATGYKAPFVAEDWAGVYNWRDGKPPPGYDDHPVTLVNWYDADAYCRWAGRRLPTEAEWEKAARGTDGRIYPWGNDWAGDACNHGRGGKDNYDVSDGYETTAPIGSFPDGRSPYGIEDMFGNAWEWTADWYSSSWREMRGEEREGTLVRPRGPVSGFYRAARGGSFFFDLKNDWRVERAFMLPETRRKSTGFRCARDAK